MWSFILSVNLEHGTGLWRWELRAPTGTFQRSDNPDEETAARNGWFTLCREIPHFRYPR